MVSTPVKDISRIGSFPQVVGMNTEKYLKPPTSHDWHHQFDVGELYEPNSNTGDAWCFFTAIYVVWLDQPKRANSGDCQNQFQNLQHLQNQHSVDNMREGEALVLSGWKSTIRLPKMHSAHRKTSTQTTNFWGSMLGFRAIPRVMFGDSI